MNFYFRCFLVVPLDGLIVVVEYFLLSQIAITVTNHWLRTFLLIRCRGVLPLSGKHLDFQRRHDEYFELATSAILMLLPFWCKPTRTWFIASNFEFFLDKHLEPYASDHYKTHQNNNQLNKTEQKKIMSCLYSYFHCTMKSHRYVLSFKFCFTCNSWYVIVFVQNDWWSYNLGSYDFCYNILLPFAENNCLTYCFKSVVKVDWDKLPGTYSGLQKVSSYVKRRKKKNFKPILRRT